MSKRTQIQVVSEETGKRLIAAKAKLEKTNLAIIFSKQKREEIQRLKQYISILETLSETIAEHQRNVVERTAFVKRSRELNQKDPNSSLAILATKEKEYSQYETSLSYIYNQTYILNLNNKLF